MTILLSKKKEFSIFGNTRHKISNKKLQIGRKWDGILQIGNADSYLFDVCNNYYQN